MKSNRFWLMLLGGLLLISAVVGWMFAGKDGKTAVVTLDGIVLAEIDLSRVETSYTIEAEGNCHNTIEFDRGRVRVSHADCPDQVCVDTGWIEDGTVPIVCLPNRLVIEITGEGDGLDISAK
ncbi:MAG: NusG domain II-containing protein [Clostridia bacterium]|nr:NusG domain II-containing protein [Clostridia bacterium]